MFHKKREIQFIQYNLLRGHVYKYNTSTIKFYNESYVEMAYKTKITIQNHVYNISTIHMHRKARNEIRVEALLFPILFDNF